jgi:hypothetical protein
MHGTILPTTQHCQQIAWPHRFRMHPKISQHLPGHTLLIPSIIDRELRRVTQLRRMPFQNPNATRMKRSNLRLGSFLAITTARPSTLASPKFRCNTMLHFQGSFIGKRYRQNTVRLDTILN